MNKNNDKKKGSSTTIRIDALYRMVIKLAAKYNFSFSLLIMADKLISVIKMQKNPF